MITALIYDRHILLRGQNNNKTVYYLHNCGIKVVQDLIPVEHHMSWVSV